MHEVHLVRLHRPLSQKFLFSRLWHSWDILNHQFHFRSYDFLLLMNREVRDIEVRCLQKVQDKFLQPPVIIRFYTMFSEAHQAALRMHNRSNPMSEELIDQIQPRFLHIRPSESSNNRSFIESIAFYGLSAFLHQPHFTAKDNVRCIFFCIIGSFVQQSRLNRRIDLQGLLIDNLFIQYQI